MSFWDWTAAAPGIFLSLVLSRLNPERPQVLTIHAELEGGPFLERIRRSLAALPPAGGGVLPPGGLGPGTPSGPGPDPGGPGRLPPPARAGRRRILPGLRRRAQPMIAAIMAAAGVGERMGHKIPKPYLLLAGKPILAHTLGVFERDPGDPGGHPGGAPR